ncbi:OmpP1/FadL family transporter [Sulfurivirga sp.]|uniref:OmpP1/FadL family transporter n=1 Tax=Sulfurivirga sp. TaxID=2614236 RepID=UPI0025D17BC1|nr:outer membrane protein transport protein [Sulfurivirga sp.]
MMKKTTLALAISAATLAATPAFATNGDMLIGLGAQSRALGGTGTAAFFGSENALTNPALLAKAKKTEISFGGTLFKPSVNTGYPAMGYDHTSKADTNVIPEVSIVNSDGDGFAWGIGMFGSAGMGVDHSGEPNLYEAQSTLQLMKFVPSVAFNVGSGFNIGAGLVLQYGALDINYKQGTNTVGSGMDQDFGFGFILGVSFDVTDNLTVGVSYDSPIKMTYKNQLSVASAPFAPYLGGTMSDDLEQPAVLGAGVAYNMGNLLMTADFKQIKWGDAKGYKQFGWEDQNVVAAGIKYSGNGYWVGAGFNHGSNPIKKNGLTSGAKGLTLNFFNYLFFPGTVENHFTLGGGYKLTDKMGIDAAIVYAPETSDTVKVNATTDLKTKHSQIGYTVSLRYDF